MSNIGWRTMHEVLDETDLSYGAMAALVDRGVLHTRRIGTVTLYDPDDVEALRDQPLERAD